MEERIITAKWHDWENICHEVNYDAEGIAGFAFDNCFELWMHHNEIPTCADFYINGKQVALRDIINLGIEIFDEE